MERTLLELERVLGVDVGAERVGGKCLRGAATLVSKMTMGHQVANGGPARRQRMMGGDQGDQLGVFNTTAGSQVRALMPRRE